MEIKRTEMVSDTEITFEVHLTQGVIRHVYKYSGFVKDGLLVSIYNSKDQIEQTENGFLQNGKLIHSPHLALIFSHFNNNMVLMGI